MIDSATDMPDAKDLPDRFRHHALPRKVPPRPLKWIEVDLAAVASNIRWTRSRLKPGVALMAVVKADAYGHGAGPVARTALAAGARVLGVLTLGEAAVLRRAGLGAPIQLLAPVLPESARDVLRLNVVPTVDSLDVARALNAAAPRATAIHLDLDFGLGRWGVPPRQVEGFLAALSRLKRLTLAGLSTHIDYVPGKNAVEAEEKLWDFHRLSLKLKERFPRLTCHAANSSVLMDFPHWQMDMVRAGNLIYGINPTGNKTAPLKNPWTFQARLLTVRWVAKGASIGYASECVAARRLRVATVPAGYADGLTMEPARRDISLTSGYRYWGMLRGRRAPFIGRCGISHLLLDVTGCPGAKTGDPVILPVRRTAASPHLPRIYGVTS